MELQCTRQENVTISCTDRDPVDVPLKAAEKLFAAPEGKGCNKTALLQPLRSTVANSSRKGEEVLIQVNLQHDCC